MMNDEDLRNALFADRLGEAADVVQSEEERKFALMNEAAEVRKQYPKATPEERETLQARYMELEKEISAIKAREMERLKGKTNKALEAKKEEEHKFERDRKIIQERGRAGAGEQTFNRIKSELNYLIANYKPSLEPQLEILIDKWRRSGDPAYDPGIRVKIREARKRKAASDHPL